MGFNDIDFDELESLFGDNGGGDGKYVDMMQLETDKEIETTRKRLAKEYKQAEKELKAKTKDYFKKFEAADKEKAKLVKDGLLSHDDYIAWRKNKILYGDTLKNKVKSMSEHLANVDKQAANIVNGKLAGVYANNYNYALYNIEKGMGAATSLVLHDEKSVERLARKNPKLLPNPSKKTQDKIKRGEIQKWSQRKINNAITQGILQGEPLMDVADRLTKVVSMEWSSAVRNARTAMTGAQNAGRLESYKDAGKLGINLKKEWMATLDEHTRSSHADLDGQSVPIDEPFVTEDGNELMYPADPDAEPEDLYNCRCTMVADLVDYPDEGFERYVDGESVGDMTYKEWLAAKSNNAPRTQQENDINTKSVKWSKEGELLKNALDSNNVSYFSAKTMRETISEDKIIQKIGGGDKTKGSCVSLCYAYVGNKHGIDVLDFRGGKSREVMSCSLYNTPHLHGVMSKVEKGGGVRAANKLISTMAENKEYILGTGRHAAVVRKRNGLIEYLELQTMNNNGWHELTSQALKQRFACASSYKGSRSELIDIDSLKNSDEFRVLLGYINTKNKKQMKGSGGFAK